MAYQTLYRKWRPITFDEVVGQEHITATLKNEIVNGKISHAYIFTGTRGTGKTSTAKILSRALNCENTNGGNPCNECSSCRGILNESILDVVEMDAASNTGVDNIREIIDQVRYTTTGTRYKVYIIDEVHMLSAGAFNALLKTLEEPPSHVVFILATTEIHKVPATILSRCQRFDFKNIGASDIKNAVGNILSKENVSISDDALEYIAYLGNGTMRDALSITEQCLAYKSTDISYEDVTDILGTLDDSFLYDIAYYIAKGDVRKVLVDFNECMKKGKNPALFAEGLLKAFRDMLMYIISPEACELGDKKKNIIAQRSKLFTEEKLIRCIDALSSSMRELKFFSNAAVIVESILVKLASPEYDADISALLDRISVLEKKISDLSLGEYVPAMRDIKPDVTLENIQSNADVGESLSDASSEEKVKVPKAGEDTSDIILGWGRVKERIEQEGNLMTFVALYNVVPKMDGNTLVLAFETIDSAKSFANSQGVNDVKAAVLNVFGISVEIKCIY